MVNLINLDDLHPEQLIDCRTAAKLLGLSWRTVSDMASRRELPLYKIRRRVLFKVGEILAYREEARIEARGAV